MFKFNVGLQHSWDGWGMLDTSGNEWDQSASGFENCRDLLETRGRVWKRMWLVDRFGDLWMWLHFEVLRGPDRGRWGRFWAGLGPKRAPLSGRVVASGSPEILGDARRSSE